MAFRWPEFEYIFAVPNGQFKTHRTASYFKKEGLKSGVPDLCWPLVTARHPGLYIEMKRRTGSVTSDNQKKWHRFLETQGYRVEVCKGSNEAIKVLESHFSEYQDGLSI
jgi:hypothetical protein